jgi:hypothetical protein
MLKQINLNRSKKAGSEFSIEKVILLILGILVLVAVIIFITKPQILDWIRNQPGYSPPLDSESELTCDQMKVLGYYKIGYVTYQEKKWDWANHYYINFEQRTLRIDSSCSGVCMVDDCPDTGVSEADCFLGDVDGAVYTEWVDGCFDKNGKPIYDTKVIPTDLYWDWNINEEGQGDLMLSKTGFNAKIGVIKNNFFEIDQAAFDKYSSQLTKTGASELLMKQLNGAKYISGGIYRSYNKPLTLSWKELRNGKDITIDSNNMQVKNFYDYLGLKAGNGLTLDFGSLVSITSSDTRAVFYLTPMWGYYSLVLNLAYSGSHEVGRIYPGGIVYFKTDYDFFKNNVKISSEVIINPNGDSIFGRTSSENIHETNLKVNYEDLENKFKSMTG